MQIVLLEPFMTGSHAAWARQYAAASRHDIEILGLDGKYWKWRMHGGAVTLAQRFLAIDCQPDLLLASDMLDLTTFLALTRAKTANIPAVLYCHENQLSYPWSPQDADPGLQRDAHYAFINYASALAADAVLFNSSFHRHDFLQRLPSFLQSFPDHQQSDNVQTIAAKSRTLPVGLDLARFDSLRPVEFGQDRWRRADRPPLLLWNHRWEYDKDPETFFRALFALQERGVPFELAVLGESYQRRPAIFAQARERLKAQIVHWGYVESFSDYATWLWRADLLPVTSMHDFFGISVVEAIYCGCRPLLPNRLAYPEHLDPAVWPDCFYQDFDQLLETLTRLGQCPRESANPQLRAQVARYDWGQLVNDYDCLLEQVATRR